MAERRLVAVGALAGCYAIGLLALNCGSSPPFELPVVQHASIQPAPVEARPQPKEPTAADLEWQALEVPESATTLYRQAGDRYLADAEPADAVRCYGNALAEGTSRDLEVAPDDSWLLMVIKQARKKERNECDK